MAQLKFHIPLDVCYGSLSLFTSVIHNIFLLYHVDVFVSVYKIDKVSFWIGEAVFLLWNSFNDPLFGWLSDRKYLSRQLKSHDDCRNDASQIVHNRLTALKWNGPLFALSFFTFWVSWMYPSIQFMVCLCLYDGFLTMIDLHHNALLADLAVSAEFRTRLNSRCSLFSALGSASVFLSYTVWNKENLTSFRYFCAALTIFSLVGFFFSASRLQQAFRRSKKNEEWIEIKPRTEEVEVLNADQAGLKTYIKQLLSQKNFLWFSCMNLIQVFHCHFNSNFFPLFLENLLGSAISPAFGSFLIGMSFVAPHLNNLYFLSLCRRYGVYSVIRVLFIVKLSISVIMFIMGPNHIWLLCLFIASNRVFTEGTCKLLNLVISDLVDEDFVLHNRTQAVSALMFGTAAFVSKPGQTLAPLIGTWLLSIQTGHDIFSSGKEVGSIKMDMSRLDGTTAAMYRQGCFQLLVYIPVICAVVQLFVWSRFNLHGGRLRWIKSVRAGAQFSTV